MSVAQDHDRNHLVCKTSLCTVPKARFDQMRNWELCASCLLLCCDKTINKAFNCIADTLHEARSKVKRYLRCCGLTRWSVHVNYTHDWKSRGTSYDLKWKGGLGREGFEHFVINTSFNYPAGVLLPNRDASFITRQWGMLRRAHTWEAYSLAFKGKIQRDKCRKEKEEVEEACWFRKM